MTDTINTSQQPYQTKLLKIPVRQYSINPSQAVKQLLGFNVNILSITTNEMITFDDCITVLVKYNSIEFSDFKTYYIPTSDLQLISPNSNKYIIKLNGCDIKITNPNIKLYPKILPVKIKPILTNNITDANINEIIIPNESNNQAPKNNMAYERFAVNLRNQSSITLDSTDDPNKYILHATTRTYQQSPTLQFRYYATEVKQPLNSICTPLKYPGHAYESFEVEKNEPLYDETFISSFETKNKQQVEELIADTLTYYQQSLSMFNTLSSVNDVKLLSYPDKTNTDITKLCTTAYVIHIDALKNFTELNGIIMIQPKRHPDYILFYPTNNFTICREELDSIRDFVDQDRINYYNFMYLTFVINKSG